jgi:ATP-binding cassette, subfamily B, bacterial
MSPRGATRAREPSPAAEAPDRAWRTAWRLARYRPGLFAASMALWVAFHALPLGVGLVLQRLFDALAGPTPAALDLAGLLAVLAGVEATRAADLWFAARVWTSSWHHMGALVRLNMLRAQLASGGPDAAVLPGTPGEAVSRFRDDVEDLLQFLDTWLDVAGTMLFAGIAVAVMVGIDPVVTVAVAVPLAGMAVATRTLAGRIRAWRRADREATAAVTGFLGELFASVLTLKAAGAGDAALGRLDELNRVRGRAALRDQLCTDLLDSFNASTVDVGIGLVLLLAAPAMRRGDFTVGDLTLFASYTGYLTRLPYFGGRLLARRRQAGVAVERMTRLLPSHAPGSLVTPRHVDLTGRGGDGSRPPAAPAAPRDRLRVLEAHRLSAVHPSSGRGVHGADLVLRRGTLTVVCGPVGSGKTTLLRALLGLLPLDAGELRWNGTPVGDPAAFLVPPRCAYVPQVPRLFSESLADNLLLGVSPAPGELAAAVRLAVLDEDLAAMPDGLATLVGARGVRLSGGQAQRAAVARAFVRRPELVVLDDVSSALDLETEARLWQGVLAGGTTCLAVSNRAATLARADQVVRLDHGRVVG